MPKRKDLKRLIRERMKKTGESYAAARAQILKLSLPSDAKLAELGGMSDEALSAKTGRTWKQWVRELDGCDAISMTHREIARRVADDYEVSAWWAQTVTVGYERIRGLREIGQRRESKTYEISKSKTLPVEVERSFAAFADESLRRQWLPDVDLEIRTQTENKSMRITWPGETSLHVYFYDKSAEKKGDKSADKRPAKSQVVVQHVGLSNKVEAEERKRYWAERFETLSEVLVD